MVKDGKKIWLTLDADEIAVVGDEEYKIKLTCTPTKDGRPTKEGVEVEFGIAGSLLGEIALTDEKGQATAEVIKKTSAKEISIEARALGARFKKFIKLPAPEKKKEAEIKCINTHHDTENNKLVVIVSAPKKNAVFYIDNGGKKSADVENGIAVITFILSDKKRDVVFFSENGQNFEIKIPSKPQQLGAIIAPAPAAEQKKPFSVRLKEAYLQGRYPEKEKR